MSRRARKRVPPRKKIQGRLSSSNFEVDIYKKIQSQNRKKHTISYEQDKIEYTLIKSYIPDFTISKKDGTILYIEAKGRGRGFDRAARKKMITVKEQHPNLDIRIVFMDDGIIEKRGKMTCSQWARKYGYEYSIGSIPAEWME
jgi:hypothetical protein